MFAGWGGACAASGTSPVCEIVNPSGDLEVTALFQGAPSVTLSVTLTGTGGGMLMATGGSWSRSCERPQGANSPTSCSWLIPIGESFDIMMSGVGSWTTGPGQLCHEAFSLCYVTSGLNANDSVSAEFFNYAPLKKKD